MEPENRLNEAKTALEIRGRMEALRKEQEALLEAYPDVLRQEAETAKSRIIAGWQEVEEGIRLWQQCQQYALDETDEDLYYIGPFSSQALFDIKDKMAAAGVGNKVFSPVIQSRSGFTGWLDGGE
ncbi:hypothetical protein [Vreelandella salicampi]|uniref:Uncharacterized protein n=1 Tax=Vreelandella salicampi TaxID=1449798 RepID=A0A7Z0LP97_9GAMM|nr:hypothetical protein [Halomonas salicampi]NYS62597.1 hypothetical protein [Halomonas salicampi]